MSKIYIETSPEIQHRIADMAAVHGMSLNDFIISRAVLEIPNSFTLAAMEELSNGGGDKYKSFGDFLTSADDE